jgi:multidrug resistance protein MdtO
MTTSALSAVSLRTSPVFEFLREELAPTPERWQQTLRITLACVIASWAVMAFHLKFSLIVLILMFFVTQRDTTSALIVTVVGLIGAAIGCGLLSLAYMSVMDIAWLRVLLIPVSIAFGLFINRIFTLGPVGSTIGIPLALGMLMPDIVPFMDGPPRPYEGGPPRLPFFFSTENLSRFPSTVWWAAALGLLVSLGVQYILNPNRASSLLVRGLLSRLEAVETTLLGLADEKGKPSQSPSLSSLALEGPAGQLSLLKLTSLVNPWLKEHKAQLSTQILLVDQLVTAAATLEQLELKDLSEPTKTHLRRFARLAANWRSALPELRWPDLPEPVQTFPPNPHTLPAFEQMDRVMEFVARAKHGQPLPEELTAIPEALKGGLIASDAFENPDYLRSAIKGALAGFICYLIFTLTNYQEIFTSVITCIVCSLSTAGASFQKGTLRFCGSAIGALLGLVALVYIFPHVDSIGGFWVPFAAVTALAAYVTVGSPAISYGGYQIGLAFYKCTLQSYGPYTELRVVRDRLIGILLGLVVFEFINTHLWPVKATGTIRARLGSTLRALADMATLTTRAEPVKPLLRTANELRIRANQDLATVHQLSVSARFEPGVAARRELENLTPKAEKLLVVLLAIVQHQADLPLEQIPAPLRQAKMRLSTVLALFLRNLEEQTAGQVTAALPDILTPLNELEQAVAMHVASITDVNVASHIRARLELWRQAVVVASQMERQHAQPS